MRYFSIILFGLLFFSCTNEEHVKEAAREVSFYIVEDDTQTRSNEMIGFAEGDAVGVYVLDKSENSALKPVGNYADNKKYIWNSVKKAFVATDNNNLIFNSPDKQLEFYVYFPYYQQVPDATSLSHVIGGTKKTDDFLFAVNRDLSGKQNLPISFKHLLSKVNVKYTSAEKKETAQMSVHTFTDTKVNLATGDITTVTNKRIDYSLEKISFPDYLLFTGLVAPQTWKSGDQFGTLSYSDKESYPFSFPQDRTFSSGEENEVLFMPKAPAYTFSVTPATFSLAALDKVTHAFSIISEKCDAINGVDLPNTTTPLNYTLTSKPDWVTITGTNLVVAENRDNIARNGIVTFTQDESNATATIDVSQAAGVTTYNYIFSLNDGNTSASWSGVTSDGDSRNYAIVSQKQTIVNGVHAKTDNVNYIASSSVDWITINGSNLVVAENRNSTSRAGVATFTQVESGKTIKVSVQQGAGVFTNTYAFAFSGGSTTASWTGVPASGTSKSYTIISTKDIIINGTKERTENVGYSGSTDANWISVSGNSVVVTENKTTSSRSGTATFTQAESGRKITISVQQSAAVITYGNWVVSVSANPTNIAAGGGTSTITRSAVRDVYTNGVKTGTETATPSLSASGTGFSLSGTTLTASNNTGSSRSCTVTATHGGVSKTCTVTQSAAVITYGNWVVSVSANPTTIAAGGGTSTITRSAVRDVYTNGVKTGTETATPSLSASGTGFSLSGTTLTASNNTGSSRSCTVTATHGGVSKTCTVTQSAAVITYNYTFTFGDGSTSSSWSSISSNGDSKGYTITSSRQVIINGVQDRVENVSYSGSSNVNWASASGSTITVQENNSTVPRGGVVTFTQAESGKTIKVTVMQLKKSSIDIN